MASPNPLHLSLLRPPILQILRATGFTTTRPSVLDTLVDLTSRYLLLLARRTAHHQSQRSPHGSLVHNTASLNMTDIRLALQDVGALYPQISECEESVRGEEDMRGVEAFVGWCVGEVNREIRRVAELTPEFDALAKPPPPAVEFNVTNPGGSGTAAQKASAVEVAALVEPAREDFLTQLKKKHAKTKDGEEARYQGTALGKDLGEREVKIEGWEVDSIRAWSERLAGKGRMEGMDVDVKEVASRDDSESDSPLSEISVDTR
ncbi:hypothetical protein N7G274_009930 [Stereocaulon virgatum]|uniref:Bromodomain associated domain-containing protein n=1 Tax=Stereocaulon virgatum TaxID=373712 RepID=A0ABR3ZWD8_9LECA